MITTTRVACVVSKVLNLGNHSLASREGDRRYIGYDIVPN